MDFFWTFALRSALRAVDLVDDAIATISRWALAWAVKKLVGPLYAL